MGYIRQLVTPQWGKGQLHSDGGMTKGHVADMNRKVADDMVESAIRLPRRLHGRLKRAGGERGMGKEIRRRLQASFDAEIAPANPKTIYLLDAISSCAEKIADDYGDWWSAFAFEVLKGCMNMLWTRFQPTGEPVPNPKPDSLAATIFGPKPKPEELSRLYVHSWISSDAKRADEEKRG